MHKYVTNSDFIMQFNWHKLTMLEIVILFTWSQNTLLTDFSLHLKTSTLFSILPPS